MLQERRSHPRIKTEIVIDVVPFNDNRPRRVTLIDVSWGGVSFSCEEPPGAVSEMVQILLPGAAGRTIPIASEILRVQPNDRNGHDVGARFAGVSPGDEDELQKVLSVLLSGSGGARREHARLAQRIELHFDNSDDIRGVLEDLSEGGLGALVPQPFQSNQTVEVAISGPPQCGDVTLRGQVVHQTPERVGDLDLFRVGLRFEHPPEEFKAMMESLLTRMDNTRAVISAPPPARSPRPRWGR